MGVLSRGIYYRLGISIAVVIHSLDLSTQLIVRLRDFLSHSLSVRLIDLEISSFLYLVLTY